MLIPMADAPRWHAERNGFDTIAIIHELSLSYGVTFITGC